MTNEHNDGPPIGGRRVGQRAQASPAVKAAATPREPEEEVGGIGSAFEEPEAAPVVDHAEPDEDDHLLETLTRKPRRGTSGGEVNFELPEHRKKPGWDYEWKVTRYAAQDTEPGTFAFYAEQGWVTCRPSEFPELCGHGYALRTVDRFGQRLFKRPMHLTDDARREDYAIAEKQKADKLASASAVPIPDSRMRAETPDIKLEYETGQVRPKEGARA